VVANHYVAFLAKSGDPKSEDQQLYLDMLFFLDDRHVPVQVCYDDRLPAWTQHHPLLANAVYFMKLLLAPPSVVLVDFGLCAKAGLAVFLAGWFRKHRIIVSLYEIYQPAESGWKRWGRRCISWACLQAAHRILVYSETIEAWATKLAPVHGKIRYFSYPFNNLGMEGSMDQSWWPLAGFKPRWHKKRCLEETLNLHVSVN
jgi:hypothetical protein